jgi:hypothetical protein
LIFQYYFKLKDKITIKLNIFTVSITSYYLHEKTIIYCAVGVITIGVFAQDKAQTPLAKLH